MKKRTLLRKIGAKRLKRSWKFKKGTKEGKRKNRDVSKTKFNKLQIYCWFIILSWALSKKLYAFETSWLTSLCGSVTRVRQLGSHRRKVGQLVIIMFAYVQTFNRIVRMKNGDYSGIIVGQNHKVEHRSKVESPQKLDPRFSIFDSRFSILNTRSSTLDSRFSTFEPRFSILESFEDMNRVLSLNCQLTELIFEQYFRWQLIVEM